MATATMLHVVDSVEPNLRVEYQNQLLGILGIDKVLFILNFLFYYLLMPKRDMVVTLLMLFL